MSWRSRRIRKLGRDAESIRKDLQYLDWELAKQLMDEESFLNMGSDSRALSETLKKLTTLCESFTIIVQKGEK